MSEIKNQSHPPEVLPQPTLKVTKSDRTRAAIVNAALDFIWTHPFRDMTVSSLTAPTGLSRSAFYQYFEDLHHLMESLLDMLKAEVLAVTGAWFEGTGDPIARLKESLDGLVDVCYRLGPIVRTVEDAAASDERLEAAWNEFVKTFDDAVTTRIEADQAQGLIPDLEARSVAIALNRLDVYLLIEAFGEAPRSEPGQIKKVLVRIWIATLYGSEWVGDKPSDLVRT